MKHSVRKRILFAGAGAVLAAAIAVLAVLHVGTLALKRQIEQALGPESEVGEIAIGWSAVELRDIVVRAPHGWPAPETLRAERVSVHPDLFALMSARVHIPRVTIDHAYLSVRRDADGGTRMLPGLLERVAQRTSAAGGEAGPAVTVGRIELRHGVLEFFDETVGRAPHKIRLEQLHATVDDLRLPALDSRTTVRLDGAVKGVRRDGRLLVDGWVEPGRRNADVATKLQGADLLALQPYLVRAPEAGARGGVLDLRLKSVVRDGRLHAPGSMTLGELELAPADGAPATFMGIPRTAVAAALRNRKGPVGVDFTLEGRLDDPRFSVNDALAARVGAAVADGLGIAIDGGGREPSGAPEGLGGVVRKLFGR